MHIEETLIAMPENMHGHRAKLLWFVQRIEALRALLGRDQKRLRILDVGCGNGTQVTLPLAAQGYALTGVDLHEPSIAYARRENRQSNAAFIVSDVHGLHEVVGEDKFDVVILSDILEHVPSPGALLKDLHRLIHPKSIVLISIPNGYGPFEIETAAVRRLPPVRWWVEGLAWLGKRLRASGILPTTADNIPYNEQSGHIQFFTQKSIAALARANGFVVNSFRNGCVLGGPLSAPILLRSQRLLQWNVQAASFLPSALCSAWHLECHPAPI